MSEAGEPKPVWGAKAIASEIGVTERQAYWLLETGKLPARKIGNKWVAYPARLRESIVGEGA